MVQTRQPHRLAAGKWLGVLDPDHVAPEPGSIADRVNHSRLSGRLVVHQLRSIAPEGLALRFELVGNVNQQAGPLNDPQVDAEIVKDPRWVKRGPGDVGPGQLAPETGVLHQLGGRGVVRVSILPVRREDQSGPDLAKDTRQLPAVNQGGLQATVRQAKILPPAAREIPAESAHRWSGRGFRASILAR